MKKLVFIFCALALTVLSCETNEPNYNAQDIDQAKIESLKTMTPDDQKTAFNILNTAERAKLWNDRINSILEQIKLNSAQKKSIIELKTFIKPELFNSANDMLNEDLKGWVMDNEDNFSKEEFYLYFTTIDNINSLLQRDYLTHEDEGGGGGGTPTCNCNRANDFCYITNPSKPDCKFLFCSGRPTGCGIIWAQSCNGVCGSN